MYIFSGYFDQTIDDPRSYAADQLAHIFRTIATSGVMTFGENLLIEPHQNQMTVRMRAGAALVNGYVFVAKEDGGAPYTLDLDGGGSFGRIDRIVLECNTNTNIRFVTPKVVKGTQGSPAKPPELVRSEETYQIALAQIKIEPGQTTIKAENILDERKDKGLCGLISPHGMKPEDLAGLHSHSLATESSNGMMSPQQVKRLKELEVTQKPTFAGINVTGDINVNGSYIDGALFR